MHALPAVRRGTPPATRGLAAASLLFLAACGASTASDPATTPAPAADGPLVVQAGAPGESTRAYQGQSLAEVEGTAFTDADVAFMQGMIHHHAQALEMTALIPDRTRTSAIRQMGLRMEISQKDEIGLMERWLRDRDLEVPEWRHMVPGMEGGAGMDHAGMDHGAMAQGSMDHDMMPGMLTPDQMAQLESAEGRDFDRLFLELMIQHHEGALSMVRDLYNSPGAAQESIVYHFASEVDADQGIEIRRMRELLEAWR